jgi:hypothetical protein
MPVPKSLCTGTLNYGAMTVVVTGPELKLDTLLTAVSENVYEVPVVRPVTVAPVEFGLNVTPPTGPFVTVRFMLATLFLFRASLAHCKLTVPEFTAPWEAVKPSGAHSGELVKPVVVAAVVPLSVVALTAKV